jgi:hypothetical protein
MLASPRDDGRSTSLGSRQVQFLVPEIRYRPCMDTLLDKLDDLSFYAIPTLFALALPPAFCGGLWLIYEGLASKGNWPL